jgi:hypothetical protein
MANFLTQDDVNNYGTELVDFAQRAAAHCLAPHLMSLEQQNAELQARLAKESRHRLDSQVEQAVPNYREIDRDPNWHRWLLGYDVLSGEVRQRLLNAAIQRGDSSSVVAFFKAYQRESGSTHAASPASGGRGRSSGNKPIYTRAQVAQLYAAHQKGLFAGRESEWARQEHDIIAAGREGRILGATDVAGK